MTDLNTIFSIAKECGFQAWAELKIDTLEFLPEVRAMCAENKCGRYNTSWSCPPACGSLEEMREKVTGYSCGVLVQTVADLKSSFDWKGMVAAGDQHKENQEKMRLRLQREYPDLLSMGAGSCTRCTQCTYPDAPCRFPEILTVSMEACGLFVSRVCKANGIPYNHGEKTVCYTGCFLLE